MRSWGPCMEICFDQVLVNSASASPKDLLEYRTWASPLLVARVFDRVGCVLSCFDHVLLGADRQETKNQDARHGDAHDRRRAASRRAFGRRKAVLAHCANDADSETEDLGAGEYAPAVVRASGGSG